MTQEVKPECPCDQRDVNDHPQMQLPQLQCEILRKKRLNTECLKPSETKEVSIISPCTDHILKFQVLIFTMNSEKIASLKNLLSGFGRKMLTSKSTVQPRQG